MLKYRLCNRLLQYFCLIGMFRDLSSRADADVTTGYTRGHSAASEGADPR